MSNLFDQLTLRDYFMMECLKMNNVAKDGGIGDQDVRDAYIEADIILKVRGESLVNERKRTFREHVRKVFDVTEEAMPTDHSDFVREVFAKANTLHDEERYQEMKARIDARTEEILKEVEKVFDEIKKSFKDKPTSSE